MPVYDTSKPYLQECFISILTQEFKDWELVVIDNESSDPEFVKGIFCVDDRVRVVRISYASIGEACNIGFECATKLRRQYEYLTLFPTVSMLGTQLCILDLNRKLIFPIQHPYIINPNLLEENKRIWAINGATIMAHMEVVKKVGGYPQCNRGEDLGLFVKFISGEFVVHNLPTVEYIYRQHSEQISKKALLSDEEYNGILRMSNGHKYLLKNCTPPIPSQGERNE